MRLFCPSHSQHLLLKADSLGLTVTTPTTHRNKFTLNLPLPFQLCQRESPAALRYRVLARAPHTQNPIIDIRQIQYETGKQDDMSDGVSKSATGRVVWRRCKG